MIRRSVTRGSVTMLLALILGGALGCETNDRLEAQAFDTRRAAGDEGVADAELFHADVSLYRRYTGSKWRLDKDHVFTIKDESHVKAAVAFHNMRPERTYSVHLAWIRPDGRELYRRYAEVTRHLVRLPDGVVPDSTGSLPGFVIGDLAGRFGDENAATIAERFAADPGAEVTVNEIVYRKAVDLGYARRRMAVDAELEFTLDSRLNISREKQRDLGTYLLRVYLDRRLLSETPFTLQDNT